MIRFFKQKKINIMAIKHSSQINIKVGLDENRVPERLNWSADDGAIDDMEAKALLLSVWDSSQKDTYKINLWTKEMPVNEMIQFFHQTLTSMADTFETATGDDKMSATMRDFCDYYAEKMGIKKQ
jgi:gliding motility-associated protein GldC